LAQQILKAWNKEVPPVQAEAMPSSLAFAMVTTLALVFKEPQAAVLVLLAFTGCLRIGEALNLRTQDVFLPRPGSADQRAVIILRATKRSFDQRVVLANGRVVNALLQYQKLFAPPNRDALFAGLTYSKFARLFKKALLVLRVPPGEWRTHSLRRGAATAMMEQGHSFEHVRLFGRWASESSCREYIRLGQSALTRISGRISPELWALYEVLGSAVDRAFGLSANGVVG
jgi:integrase